MGEYLLNTIKQLTIFMLCGQMVLQFKPTEKYGKYLRFLLEIMVLASFLLPVLSFFQEEIRDNFYEDLSLYSAEFKEDLKMAGQTADRAEERFNDMAYFVYEEMRRQESEGEENAP